MPKRIIYAVSFLLITGFSTGLLGQQSLPILRVSPKASVSQNIATFANISINYSSPAVKGREVWGTLVPYGLAPNNFGSGSPMPWRAGANETTVITFSHDVKIEGKNLKAGAYGLHMIPNEKDVTIIFNSETNSWGSFFYDKKNDALRVTVKWQDAPHMENLKYGFDNLSNNSANAYLHWGKKKIAFKIEVDRNEVIIAKFKEQLTTLPGFNQAAWGQIATFAINNKTHLDEAMTWIDKALSMRGGATLTNKNTKARLLRLQGKEKEAEEIIAGAIGTATENELNNYGYQLMNAKPSKLDDALEIFKANVQNNPASWNVYDSYAEALAKKGDKKAASKNYEKALELAPASQHTRIKNAIKAL
jgi:tetratricopeptide (TPR) repeat protein